MVRYTEGAHKRHNLLMGIYTPRLGNGSFVSRTFGTLAKTIRRYHRLHQRCILQRRNDLFISADSAHILVLNSSYLCGV